MACVLPGTVPDPEPLVGQEEEEEEETKESVPVLAKQCGTDAKGADKLDIQQLWRIHGKYYDLTTFLDKHPGGRLALEQSRGIVDATPVFESYHCLLDRKRIASTMKQFEVGAVCEADQDATAHLYSWEPDDFYGTVVKRVRAHFHGELAPNTAVFKAGWFFFAKVAIEVAVWAALYYYAFLSNVAAGGALAPRLSAAFVAAVLFIMIGFQFMHDASHYAVTSSPWMNMLFMSMWTSVALWPGRLWHKHHVIHHHSYTGSQSFDPDVHHSMPFLRKHESQAPSKSLLTHRIPDWSVPLIFWLTFCVLPGFWLGQVITYHLVWMRRKHVWKIQLPTVAEKGSLEWVLENFVGLTFIATQILGWSPSTSFAYVVGLNTAYASCIFPDHDMLETHQNQVEVDKSGKRIKDWGASQVLSSGNWGGRWFCFMCGGINYQIEHHLFPSVHHAHLPSISPIVRRTCEEFGVPYVHQGSFFSAMKSFFAKMTELNGRSHAGKTQN